MVDWTGRFAQLTAEEAGLSAARLEELGQAAWFIGRDDVSVRAWERAHLRYLDVHDVVSAVRCVFWLGFTLSEHGDLARAGVRHVGRIAGVTEGRPVLADGEALDVATVVWCTGSLPQYDWLDIPDAFDAHRWPRQVRGIAEAVPGLAFVGLPFQYSVASPTLMGMGRDAQYVVDRLFEPVRPMRTAVRAAA